MAAMLQEIIESYWADTGQQEYTRARTQRRNNALPEITTITNKFVDGSTNLQTYCDQLNKSFATKGENWGAKGHSFTMPLYKIVKTYDEKAPVATTYLRELLSDLNVENLGLKIEQFYKFLLGERTRLRQEGKPSGALVQPGSSAMMISLFTFWLHPEQQPIVYHEGVRNGMALLVKKQLLVPPPGLRINQDVVAITTANDHEAMLQALEKLVTVDPGLKNSPYWAEYFFYWIKYSFQKQNQPAPSASTLIKEQDEAGVLVTEPKQASVARETPINYTSDDVDLPRAATTMNEPLVPTPEPLLSDLIRKVQRHILVEEPIIRRIYHALLAGHVILSGPPGTGKTELARLIPETLWQRQEHEEEDYDPIESRLTKSTAYTTSLVTATDEWSVRTLISGIAPVSKDGSVSYSVKYGYLTLAILKNWPPQANTPEKWNTQVLHRSLVASSSGVERGTPQTFRGLWLVIDEFNRAPIDLALGDALTALGGNDVLRVAIDGGSAELPIPKDFRIIGTLNSFDRNYLNQISEALKRRFSFVEILPPGRPLRTAEQAIVLYKALKSVSHLCKDIISENERITWESLLIEADAEDQYTITWPDEPFPFHEAFETAWCLFEVIRIYRQLGTAQAISLVRHMLIAGILQSYTTREEWIGQALDAALCDTIADQLQVLLPDEIDVLLLALTCQLEDFSAAYNRLLSSLADRQQRLYGQLLALGRVSDESSVTYLSDEEIEEIVQSHQPAVAPEKLTGLFNLSTPLHRLPQFTRRLRAFKAERGL